MAESEFSNGFQDEITPKATTRTPSAASSMSSGKTKRKTAGICQFRSNMCSMAKLMSMIKLKKAHKKQLQKTPFWFLFDAFISNKVDPLSCKKNDKGIMKIIECYKPESKAFQLGRKIVPLRQSDISLIFGITSGERLMTFTHTSKPNTSFATRRFANTQVLTSPIIHDQLLNAVKGSKKDDIEDVARLLCLYVCATIFFPSSGNRISWTFANYIENLEDIKSYAWSEAIYRTLMASVEKSHTAPEKVKGCAITLPYWLCEHTTILAARRQHECPRFLKWNLTDVKMRLKCIALKELKKEEVLGTELCITKEEEMFFTASKGKEKMVVEEEGDIEEETEEGQEEEEQQLVEFREVEEEYQHFQQKLSAEEEIYQMTLPQSSQNKRITEAGIRKVLGKRPLGYSHETKKVIFDDPNNSRSCKKKKASIGDCISAKSLAMERAQEIQANLAPEFPSLIKFMLNSYVRVGFLLALPKHFCDLHMPKHDTEIVLEDENGEESKTKYLVEKFGLSAGWRGFSIAHELCEGDVVVFQLVEPCKFKVYIVRSNSLDEVDGALGLLNLEACANNIDFERAKSSKNSEDMFFEHLPLEIRTPQEDNRKDSQMAVNTNTELVTNHSGNDSNISGSEVLEGIRISESITAFKEVNSLENFTISVNGLIIDSELSKHIKTKYYELCCSQKSFLHDHLLEGLNCKLAAGIISETVNIADAIKECKLTTSEKYFAIWDKTLKAFEELGMNVGFLRARLKSLLRLGSESKRYGEASMERVVQADKKMQNLQEKLLEIKQAAKGIDVEVENLAITSQRFELLFQEEVDAPW